MSDDVMADAAPLLAQAGAAAPAPLQEAPPAPPPMPPADAPPAAAAQPPAGGRPAARRPLRQAAPPARRYILGAILVVAVCVLACWLFPTPISQAVLSLDGGAVTPEGVNTLSLFGACVMTAIALVPILAFIERGWFIKREDVMSSFGLEAITLYMKTFFPTDGRGAPDVVFDQMYDRRYGRYRLILPVLLLGVVVFPLSLLVARTAFVKIAGPGSGDGTLILPGQALAAITGAYAFVIAALVRAALTYNLPPVTLVNAALRLLVAAPLGYAVAVFGDGKSEFLAFAIGAFPLDRFQTIFGRWANQLLNQGLTNPVTDDSDDKALALDGIDTPMSEALADGGVTTVLELAYTDPVQLALRINVDFDVIADLQSEALAYIYLKDKLDQLRPLGLRGAVEISNLMNGENTNSQFGDVFTAACTAAGLTAGGLRNCFKIITSDPYTKFLVATWENRAA